MDPSISNNGKKNLNPEPGQLMSFLHFSWVKLFFVDQTIESLIALGLEVMLNGFIILYLKLSSSLRG